MRTIHNLGPATGAALVIAAIFVAAGCGRLDRSVARNHCIASPDCNPGRVCVAGVCHLPADGSADAPVDAATQDTPPAVEMGPDAAVDRHTIGDAGAEASITPLDTDARVDAPDATTDSVVEAGADAADAVTDGVLANGARDGRIDLPPDPCATGPGQEPAASTPGLLTTLPGFWRLCPTSAPVDPDVSWLIGSTHVIQLDARRWWRCADGQPPSCNGTAQGVYFRVLEGSNSVFHFADQIDPLNGGGADLSVHYFAGSRLLQLASCDGASRCSSNVTYLSFVELVPGS